MTTDTDRIEELAKLAFDEQFKADGCQYDESAKDNARAWFVDGYNAGQSSLSAELTELRQAKESLDWVIENLNFKICKTCGGSGTVDDAEPGDISYNTYYCDKCQRGVPLTAPPYLKSRLEGKK